MVLTPTAVKYTKMEEGATLDLSSKAAHPVPSIVFLALG
jgi:hypothetical protein